MRLTFSIKKSEPHNIKAEIIEKHKQILWLCMNKMEELAKKHAPVDTGMFRRRIHLDPPNSGSKEYTLADGVDYGIHLEYGTKPHYVPIKPLIGWSRRVLKDEQAAYSVRAKIAKYGTPAQPSFRPALMEVKMIWRQAFSRQVFGTA